VTVSISFFPNAHRAKGENASQDEGLGAGFRQLLGDPEQLLAAGDMKGRAVWLGRVPINAQEARLARCLEWTSLRTAGKR
jgi:hypothetical protein